MNPEFTLKLQAYLDNELPPAEARFVTQELAHNPEAQALFEELQSTKRLLAGSELERSLPETREFYWSKIEREIAPRTKPARSWAFLPLPEWCFRSLAPVVGTGMLVVLALFLFKPNFIPQKMASYFHEIDMPVEEDDAISFHSQETGMTVVWIAAK